MDYYLNAFKLYAQFNGRATRKEYWMFTLLNTIVIIALTVAGAFAHQPMLALAYHLIALIPSWAIAVRRAHDAGKSGWFLWIPIYSLILLCKQSIADDAPTGTSPPQSPENFSGRLKTFDRPLPALPLKKVGS